MSKKKKDADLFTRRRKHPVLCRCKACGHRLSDPESVKREIGPTCWAKGGGERFQLPLGLEEPR